MSHSRHADHAQQPPPPPPHSSRDSAFTLISAGLVPISMSAAAAVTSIWSQDHEVARTAWIAVAIVGTATMISAAVSVRPLRRPPPPPYTGEAASAK